MINGDLFTITLPRLNPAPADGTEVVVTDANNNYFVDNGNRATNCCECDKGTRTG